MSVNSAAETTYRALEKWRKVILDGENLRVAHKEFTLKKADMWEVGAIVDHFAKLVVLKYAKSRLGNEHIFMIRDKQFKVDTCDFDGTISSIKAIAAFTEGDLSVLKDGDKATFVTCEKVFHIPEDQYEGWFRSLQEIAHQHSKDICTTEDGKERQFKLIHAVILSGVASNTHAIMVKLLGEGDVFGKKDEGCMRSGDFRWTEAFHTSVVKPKLTEHGKTIFMLGDMKWQVMTIAAAEAASIS